jgi:hypothetical protein
MTVESSPVESFDFAVAQLQVYAARENHSSVPWNHAEGYFSLGTWVEDIKIHRRSLSPAQQTRLESVKGWNWDSVPRRTRSDSTYNFEKGLVQVSDWAEIHGHSRVPQLAPALISEEGKWVKITRGRYSTRQLSEDQRRRVEALPGWEWSEQKALYREHAEDFDSFLRENSSSVVPPNERMRDGSKLKGWVSRQRRDHLTGALSDEKIRVLEALPRVKANILQA